MKNIIIAILIMLTACLRADVTTTAQMLEPEPVSTTQDASVAEKPSEKKEESKITTGGWIWIGVLIVVSILAGGAAYSTKKPINNP